MKPAFHLPLDADAATCALADGLCDVFGFAHHHNVAPILLAHRPVLLMGWRDYYCEAVGRFPGRCFVVWPYGWAETERLGAGARLSHALKHLRAGTVGMFWGEIGDVPPDGAVRLPPVWETRLVAELPSIAPSRRVAILDADGGLFTALAAIYAASATPCLPCGAAVPDGLDMAAHARAEAVWSIVGGRPHVLCSDGHVDAHLAVHLPTADAWSSALVRAIQQGTPAIVSEAVTWAALLPDDIQAACIAQPAKSSAVVADLLRALLDNADLRTTVLREQRRVLDDLEVRHREWTGAELRTAGFHIHDTAPTMITPSRRRLVLYADTPGWAQHHFVVQLAREAERWGWSPTVETSQDFNVPAGALFYSPVAGMPDHVLAAGADACGGLWSHVSYGGWFTDDPLDPAKLPKARMHATNLYLHALTGLPYLAAGVDTDKFHPPTGSEAREKRHARDPRLVIGWTGSLQYNAAVKLFNDLWVPAVRKAGSDGPLAEARFCARPLAVWDSRDARTPDEVAEYLRGIDIYLCTSISEGCSLSVLEAAASGCVVLSTPCGNAPELAQTIVPWNARYIAGFLSGYHEKRASFYDHSERARETVMKTWAWATRRDAWQAFLAGSSMEQPDHAEVLAVLSRSRKQRELAAPPFVRGNMHGS